MSKLTTKQRNSLPSSEFAIPSERKFPINDKSHAANAKARASQQAAKGNLSMSEKHNIDSKADKKLTHRPEAESRGKHGRGHETPGLGKVGGHTNVVNAHSHAEKMKHC